MSSSTGSFAGDCSFPVWVAGERAERCFKRSCEAFISRQFTVVTSSFLSKLCGQQLVSGQAVPRRFSAALPRRQPALGITAGSTEMLFFLKKNRCCAWFLSALQFLPVPGPRWGAWWLVPARVGDPSPAPACPAAGGQRSSR